MNKKDIKTYIINLKHRVDRREHVARQFHGRDEFNVSLVVACEHKVGAIGLWKTLKQIISTLSHQDEYILICEDDHEFTEHYDKEFLWARIREAKLKDADILLGGISWYESALQVSSDLFWVDRFSGLQFTIIYRKFFDTILTADFGETDAADYKISALTKNKLLIYPFISSQKEFGYSDVTAKNNASGRVTQLFSDSLEKLSHLKSVYEFYNLENY